MLNRRHLLLALISFNLLGISTSVCADDDRDDDDRDDRRYKRRFFKKIGVDDFLKLDFYCCFLASTVAMTPATMITPMPNSVVSESASPKKYNPISSAKTMAEN